MRVVVQERRRLVRAGIARLLADPHRGVEVVAVAGDAKELVEVADAHRVDVAVLELAPDEWDVSSLVALLSARHPRCRFVALYHGRLEDHRQAADGLGVEAVSYASGAAGLRAAIRGRRAALTAESRPERRRLPSRALLDERERAVLRRMAAGDTAAEAGERLGLSARAVELTQQSIIRKLGARGRAHAVAVAHRIGALGAA
ncbi:MAG TPA: LuxR C-terminal-related transcriptional regulator [Acidimicrobiales bacterium]|jgi:DNA-binding NarL/FixJ family response regulator